MRALALALFSFALATSGCSDLRSCPSTLPADGTSCSHRGFVCEYNGGDHERCSTIATCSNTPTSTWSTQRDATCTNTNDPSCAPTFLATPAGQTCTTPGISCDYPDDGRCSCVPCGGGTMTGAGYAWQCRSWDQDLDPQCPSDRPALGSACKKDGVICRYDDKCTVSFGPDIECLAERWQPLSGGAVVCATPVCGIGSP